LLKGNTDSAKVWTAAAKSSPIFYSVW
jgi:hypothetical protein